MEGGRARTSAAHVHLLINGPGSAGSAAFLAVPLLFSSRGTGSFQRARAQISNVCENQEKKYVVFHKMHKDEKTKVYFIVFLQKVLSFPFGPMHGRELQGGYNDP